MGHATRSRSSQARVAHAAQAAEISEFTRALVCAQSDDCAVPGEFVTQARRVRVMALDLLTRAVIVERANGSTWEQIAASLGMWRVGEDGDFLRDNGRLIPDPRSAQDRYEGACTRWNDGGNIQSDVDRASVDELDRWYLRHEAAEGRPIHDEHPLGGHI